MVCGNFLLVANLDLVSAREGSVMVVNGQQELANCLTMARVSLVMAWQLQHVGVVMGLPWQALAWYWFGSGLVLARVGLVLD